MVKPNLKKAKAGKVDWPEPPYIVKLSSDWQDEANWKKEPKKRDFNDRVNDFLDGPYCIPVCVFGIAICILMVLAAVFLV